MNQARTANLISRLNYTLLPRARKLKNSKGAEGRIIKLQKTLSTLFKYERIELYYNRADETRGYVEALISHTLRYGSCDKRIMELADFWILEKQLIHKFFNVILPRYEKYTTCYTSLYSSPRDYPGMYYKKAILELKGNPLPKVLSFSSGDQALLQNLLLSEAKKEHHIQQYKTMITDSFNQLKNS